MIYDDLHVVDLTDGIAGAYCAKLLTDLGADVVFATPIANPLFTYLRTSQRHASDLAPWLATADIVIVGEPGRAPDGSDPLVTVSITPVGHGGPDDGLVLTDEVVQARCGSLSNHGHMHRSPLIVGGRLGEFVTGVYAALGAATAWRRASRSATPEVVDVSMLEAMQLTFTITPTLMSHFPGGRPGSFRFVMIPGNEPTGDDRYVGITTVTEQQWKSLARVIGRDDMADDAELGTMIGRFKRAAEVNSALRAWTGARTADEIVAACVEARVPATIVGNGAELPRFDHVIDRAVLVPQPGESWIRPRAPFRFHGVADRVLTAPAEVSGAAAWSARARDAVRKDASAEGDALPLAGVKVLDFTAFWAGPAATSWLRAMGADVIKVEAVQRPRHSVQRGGAAERRAAVLRDVGLVPRGEPREARDHARPRSSRRLGLGPTTDRTVRRRRGELHAARARAVRPRLRRRARGVPRHRDGPHARVRPRRAVAYDRPGFAQTMEQITGMAWVTGYEGGPPIIPGGVVDPMVGAHASLAMIAALEHRARTGEGQLVEVPLLEVATAVTAEQVISYSIDETMLDRRGTAGVYKMLGDDAWVAIDVDSDPMAADERAQWCATRDAATAAAELLAAGVPAAAMVPGHETIDDPQLRARGFFEAVDHVYVGTQQYPTWPVRMSAGPAHYWSGPAPTLGQHNEEVLRTELGVTDDELARLRDEHVIGTVPYFG